MRNPNFLPCIICHMIFKYSSWCVSFSFTKSYLCCVWFSWIINYSNTFRIIVVSLINIPLSLKNSKFSLFRKAIFRFVINFRCFRNIFRNIRARSNNRFLCSFNLFFRWSKRVYWLLRYLYIYIRIIYRPRSSFHSSFS